MLRSESPAEIVVMFPTISAMSAKCKHSLVAAHVEANLQTCKPVREGWYIEAGPTPTST